MQDTTGQAGVSSDPKLTAVQCFWLQHYQACQVSEKATRLMPVNTDWPSNRSTTGRVDCGKSRPLTPLVFQKVPITSVAAAGIQCQVQFANGLAGELVGLDVRGLEQVLQAVSQVPR